MKSKFNQKTIDAYQLNAISYIVKLIEDRFSISFAKKFIEDENYRYEQHKKIDESKGIKHDDVCDCYLFYWRISDDPVSEYLKPHKKALLNFENLFEDMIEIIIDKGLNPQISIDYLDTFRNDPDYFSDILLMSDSYGINFRYETVDNERVTIVAPDVTNKDKEELFLANYL
jgi:hypothetical protein